MIQNKGALRLGLLIVAVGIGLMLYPLTMAAHHMLTAETRLAQFIENPLSAEQQEVLYSEAQTYNATLDGSADGAVDPFEMAGYATASPIDIPEGDVFAYVSLPKLGVHLPVYLGASDYHLSLGAAHVDGTNLPIGGEGTRSVIAAHRGYYSQPMFLNIDTLNPGDHILLYVLGDILEYEVYAQEIIHPSEHGKLAVIPEKDILTLLTCTLNFINPDRLLVHAVRLEAPSNTAPETIPPLVQDPHASGAGTTPRKDTDPSFGPEDPGLTAATTSDSHPPTQASAAPSGKAQARVYGVVALTGALWVALLIVIFSFLRTLKLTTKGPRR